uniref:protein naked cuticle homolog 2 n=1 Tax=Semicossyphus pulcher TaxID=241346 RepID=UPI0037E75B85
MGKFQSKLASKRRQSPEGGSLTSNVLNCQREREQIHIHKTKLTENLYVELRENKSDRSCNNKVLLPPKKTPAKGHSLHLQVNKQTKKRSGHVGVTECGAVLDEDAEQEWLFTLYNFDNSGDVTKEDMCSLIHSMYEVLEASVKQPYDGTFPLKIKLVVTPSADLEKTSQIGKKSTETEASASQEATVRRLYCADENMERRNHYLDLAGIENYSSKFDDTESPSQEHRQDVHAALQHRPVAIRENCISLDSPRGLLSPYALKSRAVSVGKDRIGVEGKTCRCHHILRPHPAAQRTHSKRLRSRAPDAASHLQPSSGAVASAAQRHEHHHQHEHHHHHHHHYHPSLTHLNT